LITCKNINLLILQGNLVH